MPITCLGLTFTSDDERRDHFRAELRRKLPELKQIEGFPIGEDDDIINLSDPPYYTACPNPWLNDFVAEWEAQKADIPNWKPDFVVDEPYAGDVSEGKNNPIYNAHSYHTKVPHPAIMRYILHYTQPGDIVFDGFAGTGMTGVAAQICGNPDAETKHKIELEFRDMGLAEPSWGTRRAICGDLSPIASFIAYNYNTPVDVMVFEQEARRILAEVEAECGWMYTTLHCPVLHNQRTMVQTVTNPTDGQRQRLADLERQYADVETALSRDLQVATDPRTVLTQAYFDSVSERLGYERGLVQPGRINYTVWSDIFNCPNCGNEIVFWDVAVEKNTQEVNEHFYCSTCGTLHTKRSVEKSWVTSYDTALQQTVQLVKSLPVNLIYKCGKKRFDKIAGELDRKLTELLEQRQLQNWFPKNAIVKGDKTSDPFGKGIYFEHQFYTKRDLAVIAFFWEKSKGLHSEASLRLCVTSLLQYSSKLSRWRQANKSGPLNLTLYVASMIMPLDAFTILPNRVKRIVDAKKTLLKTHIGDALILTASSTQVLIKNDSIDYIFVDPPFGANIMYSELNQIYESWLKVRTNNKSEAIENRTQKKYASEYQYLMTQSFREYFRTLKPGKWMTVEFSNTSAAVWNGIQTALQRAGFVVANVAGLDKKQGSFNAVNNVTSVKQDLVISCYKPKADFADLFATQTGEVAVWEFIAQHLHHLPVHLRKGNSTTAVVERSPKILYDRLITFYLMRNLPVPVDAPAFQAGLRQRFTERDGMVFLPEQAAEYDRKKATVPEFVQLSLIVSTEDEGVQWIRQQLAEHRQNYQDLQPKWLTAIAAVRKGDILPELRDLLQENFIQLPNGSWRNPDPNEAADRNILRIRALLKEFDSYLALATPKGAKKLKEVRVEALRVGFQAAVERKDYSTVLTLGDRIPQNLLLEDEKLLMFYDIASAFS
jgi:DNA modification methylase/predicted RNA-binding Zn-ribbon protein involved in translation (DUF1610 family)